MGGDLDSTENYGEINIEKINTNIKSVLEVTLSDFLEINIPEVVSLKNKLDNLLSDSTNKINIYGIDYINQLSNILNNFGQKAYNTTIRNYDEFKNLELEEMLYIIHNFGGDCNHISIFYKKVFDLVGLKSKIASLDSHSDILLEYDGKYYLVDTKGLVHIKVGTKIMGFNGDISLINNDYIFINENKTRIGLKIKLIKNLDDFKIDSSGKISIHLRNFKKEKRTIDLEYITNGVEFNIDGKKFILPDTLIGSAIYKLKNNNIIGMIELVTKTSEYNFFAHYINNDNLIIFLNNYLNNTHI